MEEKKNEGRAHSTTIVHAPTKINYGQRIVWGKK
jgi:hypothetical protein